MNHKLSKNGKGVTMERPRRNAASVGIDECVVTRDEDDSVVKVAETIENNEGCSSASGCGKENPWNLYKTRE
nr:hypothetical protein [Tanacetum cinerariifolium]